MKNEELIFFPSYYLAPISYYALLAQYETVYIDTEEPYRKQTLRNRCWIASPNGPLPLTIPVVKFVPYHTLMRDIRISDHGNWRHLHWNALVSSYRRTPFFEFYADDFAPFYEKKWEFLVDYNQALQEMVRELIDGEWRAESGKWRVESGERNGNSKQQDNVSSLHYSPSTIHQKDITPRPYYQLFSDRHGFLANLSIVDLLFNMGPESILVLKNALSTIHNE